MSAEPVENVGGVAVDATITRSVKALLAWHQLPQNGSALAGPLDTSEDTIARRLKRGGWEAGEVFALAVFFGVPVGDLYIGHVDLTASRLEAGVRLSRQQETAGGEPHSGSDIDQFLDACEGARSHAA